ncbi:DUF1661 domain-containing protein [Porphyromonas gingivalis]|nr:DUF1661 domain-containing protein [Porphyromonas gingivalis]
MARELKFFGTTAKKISRRFLRIYRPLTCTEKS